MSTISASAGNPLSKHHAASTKAAAHHQATTSLSHAAKTTATRTPTASPANEEANESSSERLAESVKAGRSKQLSQSAHGLLATTGKLLNKLV
jgi:hypothetical protein